MKRHLLEDGSKAILQTLITQDGLRISIIPNPQKIPHKKWSGLIPSIESEQKLSQYFQTFEQVIQYMLEKDHIKLDLEQKTLKIVAVVNISLNKVKQIELAEVPLIFLQESFMQQTQKIISRCQESNHLAENEVKQMIWKLSVIMCSLMENNKKEQMEQNMIQGWNKQRIEYNKEFECKITQIMEQKICKISKQFYEIKDQINNNIKYVRNQFNQIKSNNLSNFQKKFKQTAEQMQKVMEKIDENKQMSNKIQQKLVSLSASFTHQDQTQAIIKKIRHLGQNVEKVMSRLNQLEQQQKNVEDFVNPSCYDYRNLKLQGDKIIASYPSYIFGRKKIINNSEFSITPLKIKNVIAIGIVDQEYLEMADLTGVQNLIIFCSNGSYSNGKQENFTDVGYDQDEKITVVVNFQSGWVEWRIGSEVRLRIQEDILKNKGINWVPYIYLNDKRDSVCLG